jgi:crossover junction endodeoxyribonuclease RuvC
MPRYASAAWRAYRPNAVQPVPVTVRSSAPQCRILGLDPGSLRTGYAVIDVVPGRETHVASGCIRVRGENLAVRLRVIYEAVHALSVQHQPDEIAIERVFMHKNADSALKLGQARGAALCAATVGAAPVHEYAPRAIKQAVTGYGAADKLQIIHMVSLLLGLTHRPGTDEADALAIALCHAQTRRMAGRMAAS